MKSQQYNTDFIKSALTLTNRFNDIAAIKLKVSEQNQLIGVSVKKILFSEMDNWSYSVANENIAHVSGKYFSIDGIKVETNWGYVSTWEQPIINQPEIGYLGFITKIFDGVLHFLLQAKIEPGNVNNVQLSPTLQATKSNYTQVHQGNKPAFLDYFIHATSQQVLVDQLQSEQGARFLRKRNRNIIIRIEEELEVPDNFMWLTLAQIKRLMREDNIVNMDTRTVISGIPYGTADAAASEYFGEIYPQIKIPSVAAKLLSSILQKDGALNTFDDIINFITKKKCFYDLSVRKIPLCSIHDWVMEPDCIRQTDNKYFKVIATKVEIENREVVSWCQPMIEPAQEGICAFVCKEIGGVIHFAVQAKLEAGNFDIIEFAPTVQCLTGSYKNEISYKLPFLEYVLKATPDQIIYDTLQSEEGGRFYREQNRNMLVLAGDEISDSLPDNYIWMTLNQLQTFIKFNNYINIQARSLIAAINFI